MKKVKFDSIMLNKFCYILEVIIILVGIAGITGIGKSFYKDKLVEELGFEKVKILTTREARIGEKIMKIRDFWLFKN